MIDLESYFSIQNRMLQQDVQDIVWPRCQTDVLSSLHIRCLFKKYAECLNCADRVGFRRIRLVSLGSYILID